MAIGSEVMRFTSHKDLNGKEMREKYHSHNMGQGIFHHTSPISKLSISALKGITQGHPIQISLRKVVYCLK